MPSDYTFVENSWGNSFYKVYSDSRQTYAGAKGQCESDGAFLAIPRSQAENDFLMSNEVWPNGWGRESIWIGIDDIAEEGSFVAVDGSEISWTNWATDEPKSDEGDWNDGVELVGSQSMGNTNDGRWNDQQTGQWRKFICSIDIEGKFFEI